MPIFDPSKLNNGGSHYIDKAFGSGFGSTATPITTQTPKPAPSAQATPITTQTPKPAPSAPAPSAPVAPGAPSLSASEAPSLSLQEEPEPSPEPWDNGPSLEAVRQPLPEMTASDSKDSGSSDATVVIVVASALLLGLGILVIGSGRD
jgi:hypothetical protein